MKFISWNVNGLRALLKKDFQMIFTQLDADFFCIQETKLQQDQVDLALPGYYQYFNDAVKKGYSGTAIFTKHQPLTIHYGLNDAELDQEGRLITLEYSDFYLLTCYTPNSQSELKRLDFRLKWDQAFQAYLQDLQQTKPVICCGDLNVAHQEIDLKNPKANHHNAGFSDAERESFTQLLALGFTDTFRYFHPEEPSRYSWWSYRFNARKNNAGWRIDYFIISQSLQSNLVQADILSDIVGSDHCPILLETKNLTA